MGSFRVIKVDVKQKFLNDNTHKHMEFNKKTAIALGLGILALGSIGSIALQTFAQTSSPTANPTAAVTGQVSQKQEDNDKETADDAITGKVAVDEATARQTAQAAYPGTKILRAELENENETPVYSIKLDNATEVKIDANSGKIISTEAEQNESKNEHAKGKGDQAEQETSGAEQGSVQE